ncbi:MAG TPA: VanZ family protein [Anaerolineales bacterium]|nr:VanZ family protein [Anaerolineales bacterium]
MKQFSPVRWLPALLIMGIIFWFSSLPSEQLPQFDWADRLIKKSGHVLGYAILGASYWYALGMQAKHRWYAWLLAVAYAVTDEFHQSFVPGRGPSAWDILIFDNLGTLLGLWFANRKISKR